MSFGDDDGQQGLVLAIVFGLIALVVAMVLGLAIASHNFEGSATPSTVAPAPLPAAPPAAAASAAEATQAAQAASDEASVKVEYGVVKFYFASGKADLAAGAGEALEDLVKRLTPGHSLVISGFHDATGDAVKNAELAKQRAMAVRDALKKAGIKPEQLQLKKPQQMAAGGSDAEARRVEVTLE